MEKRKLGQGLEVSALSLGAMGYGKSRDIPDRPEMIALLHKAVDLGMDIPARAAVYFHLATFCPNVRAWRPLFHAREKPKSPFL